MDQLFPAIVGVVVGFALSYVRKKGENLATKEDVGDIKRAIEAPKTEYVQKAEQIRADVQVSLHERQTRFADRYKKQVEAVVGLQQRLVRTQGPSSRSILQRASRLAMYRSKSPARQCTISGSSSPRIGSPSTRASFRRSPR